MRLLEKIYYCVFLYCILAVAVLLTYGIYRTAVYKPKDPVKCELPAPTPTPAVKEIPNKNHVRGLQ